MSSIVRTPELQHSCAPGWTWTPIPAGHWLEDLGKGGSTGAPPSPSDYPKGTVWACDCGRTWVSGGRCAECWQVHFRREGRFGRRRRERSHQ